MYLYFNDMDWNFLKKDTCLVIKEFIFFASLKFYIFQGDETSDE